MQSHSQNLKVLFSLPELCVLLSPFQTPNIVERLNKTMARPRNTPISSILPKWRLELSYAESEEARNKVLEAAMLASVELGEERGREQAAALIARADLGATGRKPRAPRAASAPKETPATTPTVP